MNEASNAGNERTLRSRIGEGEGPALLGCGIGIGVLALLFVAVVVLLINRQPEVEAIMLVQQRELVLSSFGEEDSIDRSRLIEAFDRAEATLRRGSNDPLVMQRLWTQLMEFNLGARDRQIESRSVDRLIDALDEVSGKSRPRGLDAPGREPDDPGRQPDDPGRQPDDPGRQPDDPGRQPDDPGHQPDVPGRQPDDPGLKPDDPGPVPLYV